MQNSVKVILRKMLETLKSLRSYMTYTVYDLRKVRKGLNIFVKTRRPPDKQYKEYLDLLVWSLFMLQKNAPGRSEPSKSIMLMEFYHLK